VGGGKFERRKRLIIARFREADPTRGCHERRGCVQKKENNLNSPGRHYIDIEESSEKKGGSFLTERFVGFLN